MKETEDRKETENRKELSDTELETVAGGHIRIITPDDPQPYVMTSNEPKDGGAPYN